MKKKELKTIATHQSKLINMQEQMIKTMSEAVSNLDQQNCLLMRTVRELAHEDINPRRMQEIRNQFPRQQ